MMDAITPIPPDGGWGWVIVFSSFYIHAMCMGLTMALGVLYVSWLEAFQSGKSETSWIVSIAVAVMYGIGPFAAALAVKIGYRAMAIVGGVMMGVGFLLSSFASSVFALMITLGVIAGAGFGLSYLSAIAVPAFYFDKKRSMAMGLGSAGTGAGMFLLAPLMNLLIEMYGWRGTMLFLSGICLNTCVVAALMRPLKAPRNDPDQSVLVANEKGNKDMDSLIVSNATLPPRYGSRPSILVPTSRASGLDSVSMDDGIGSSIYIPTSLASGINIGGTDGTESAICIPTSVASDINRTGFDDLSALAMSNESMRTQKKKKKIAFMNVSPSISEREAEGTIQPDEEAAVADCDKNNNGADTDGTHDALVLKERDTNVQQADELKNDTSTQAKTVNKKYVNKPVKGGPFYHYKSDIPKMARKYSFGSKSHIQRDKKSRDKLRTNINLMLDYTPSSKPPVTYIHMSDLSNELFLSKLERKKIFNQDRVTKRLPAMEPLDIPRSVSDQKLSELPTLTSQLLPASMEIQLTPPIIGGSMHQLGTTLPSELDVEASRGYQSVIELPSGGSRNVDKLISTIKPRDVYISGSMYNLMALERSLSRSRRSVHRVSHPHDRPRGHSMRSLIRSDPVMYRRTREPDEPTLLEKIKEGIKTNFLLCKDPTFFLFALSNFLTNLSMVMPMVFMVDRAISFGIDKESASMLISLNGAGTICGRVTSALVADRKWMNRLLAYILTLTFAGIATSFSPLCADSLALHATYASCFGLLTGVYGALCPCVLVDLKGLESVGQSYGLLLLYMGVSTLIGTPLGGLIYDLCGNYRVPFILHGAFITASGLILVPLLIKRINFRKH